jgi:hypothetical protein
MSGWHLTDFVFLDYQWICKNVTGLLAFSCQEGSRVIGHQTLCSKASSVHVHVQYPYNTQYYCTSKCELSWIAWMNEASVFHFAHSWSRTSGMKLKRILVLSRTILSILYPKGILIRVPKQEKYHREKNYYFQAKFKILPSTNIEWSHTQRK